MLDFCLFLFIFIFIHFIVIFLQSWNCCRRSRKKHPFHPHPYFYSFFLSRTRYLHLLGQLTLKRKVKVTAWIIADQLKPAMATRKAVWLFFLRNRPALLLHEKKKTNFNGRRFFWCAHTHVCMSALAPARSTWSVVRRAKHGAADILQVVRLTLSLSYTHLCRHSLSLSFTHTHIYTYDVHTRLLHPSLFQ